MRISFRLALEDYYDALQVSRARNRRIRGIAVFTMAVVLAVVLMREPNVPGGHPIIALVCLLVILLGSIPTFSWLERRSFKNSDNKGAASYPDRELTIEISETGIETVNSVHRDEWSRFSKYSESDNAFILYRDNTIYSILPKRAFDSEGISSFRRILEAKLSKH
jgi:hypothetical protein